MRPVHRSILLAALLLQSACTVPPEPFAVAAPIEAASVMIFQRDVLDLIWSGLTGRDCSIVRLDQGQSYCRPIDPPPGPLPYCTRSIGRVDCWTSAAVLPDPPPGVADGPNKLTDVQESRRTKGWP